MSILQYIGTGLLAVLVTIGGWLGYQQEQLGATIPVVVAVFETSLSSAITTTDTSMTLVTGTDKVGDSLDGYICFTIDGGKTNEEFVCGTASSTSVTGVIRGLSPITASSTGSLIKSHRAGANVKVTDYPQLTIISRILNGDETVPNKLQYATSTNLNFSNNLDIPDKYYVDTVATSGAAFGDYITQGLLELATTSELQAGTATSAADQFLVVPSDLVNESSTASHIPIALSTGYLDQGWWNLTQSYTYTGPFSITGTTTLASTTINNTLAVTGTSTFLSTTTFSAIPTLPNATPTEATQTASKGYADSLIVARYFSDNLRYSDDGTSSLAATSTYIRMRETLISQGGSMRIDFGLRNASDTADTVYGKIYVNNSAVGTERSTTSSTVVNYTETFYGLSPGDLIQIYGKSTYCEISNFRFYYDTYATDTLIYSF